MQQGHLSENYKQFAIKRNKTKKKKKKKIILKYEFVTLALNIEKGKGKVPTHTHSQIHICNVNTTDKKVCKGREVFFIIFC